MIRYARLRPGRGWRPFRGLLYAAYRFGVASPFGQLLAGAIAAAVSLTHPSAAALWADPDLEHLRRDGYALLPPLLLDGQIEEILSFLDRRKPIQNGVLADFELCDVVNCPHIMEMANHPRLLALASSYLGCAPTISSISLRWSQPTEHSVDVQNFHRDPDDWRMVKFFTYLTDVAEDTGPHIFVAGSHREQPPLRSRRYLNEEVAARYGEEAIVSIKGPRGTMFVADTSGIHKGAAPRRCPRLLFEVGYTLLPVYSFEYDPVPMEQEPFMLDPYINRLVVRSAAPR